MDTIYCVPAWQIAAWGVVAILLVIASYLVGAWVGWRSKPVNFYTIARCELSSKTNYTKVTGCPIGREGVPHAPMISGPDACALERAHGNPECAPRLETPANQHRAGE